jgi:hypothetical protein
MSFNRTYRWRMQVAALAAVAALVASAVSAFASSEQFAYSTPMYSGQSYYSGTYRGALDQVWGRGGSPAYTGVWVSDSSLARVSAAAYCETDGCAVNASWNGPYPNGYPTVHHHGNTGSSVAYFNATDFYH